jgi:hypothetical protein
MDKNNESALADSGVGGLEYIQKIDSIFDVKID